MNFLQNFVSAGFPNQLFQICGHWDTKCKFLWPLISRTNWILQKSIIATRTEEISYEDIVLQ